MCVCVQCSVFSPASDSGGGADHARPEDARTGGSPESVAETREAISRMQRHAGKKQVLREKNKRPMRNQLKKARQRGYNADMWRLEWTAKAKRLQSGERRMLNPAWREERRRACLKTRGVSTPTAPDPAPRALWWLRLLERRLGLLRHPS